MVSSSRIVTVWARVVPRKALVTVLIVTVKFSSHSKIRSCSAVTVKSTHVAHVGMVTVTTHV